MIIGRAQPAILRSLIGLAVVLAPVHAYAKLTKLICNGSRTLLIDSGQSTITEESEDDNAGTTFVTGGPFAYRDLGDTIEWNDQHSREKFTLYTHTLKLTIKGEYLGRDESCKLKARRPP